MIESVFGFSAGSSFVGQLINGLVLVAVIACAAKCCWAICYRPRWREE